MMYDTDQCGTRLNSLWFLCVFRIFFCVGCFGGTVLCAFIEYHT